MEPTADLLFHARPGQDAFEDCTPPEGNGTGGPSPASVLADTSVLFCATGAHFAPAAPATGDTQKPADI